MRDPGLSRLLVDRGPGQGGDLRARGNDDVLAGDGGGGAVLRGHLDLRRALDLAPPLGVGHLRLQGRVSQETQEMAGEVHSELRDTASFAVLTLFFLNRPSMPFVRPSMAPSFCAIIFSMSTLTSDTMMP